MKNDQSLEREKWLAELKLREREIAIREREQQNKDAELALKQKEQRAANWRNPLTVAVFAAAVAAAGNAVVAVVNGSSQRELDERKRGAEIALERSKAESTRILEMIKTGDAESAAANLDFLQQSGLITDPDLSEKVAQFLKNRKPGSGPSLPAPDGQVKFEKSELLADSVRKNLEDFLARYFDYLDNVGFPKPTQKVTVVVEAMESPNSYYDANGSRIVIDSRVAEDEEVALREYTHHVLVTDHNRHWTGQYAALESGLADYFTCSFKEDPNLAEKAARAFGVDQKHLRTLANERSYAEFEKLKDIELVYGGTEIWGGFLWSIRNELGASEADALIASTWISFKLPANDNDVAREFIAALLMAAEEEDSEAAVKIKAVATKRQFPI